jgi:HPt (histidine-containing phosphotransfer) domain-containing protein
MTVDPFTDRLERVRHRFVSTLEGKIQDAYAAIPQLADGLPAAVAVAAELYRCMHGIVGISPTVGFPATGGAARAIENVLRPPQREKRGLSDREIIALKECLQPLREAAERELQQFLQRS